MTYGLRRCFCGISKIHKTISSKHLNTLNQFLDLAPIDPDGDIVRCRWATAEEAGGAAFQPALHPSISLDENCIVHYDGTLDSVASGVKPIALMMEDMDMLGNIKSSIPVQFLAQVWTPLVQRNGALIPNDNPYPKWFPAHHVRHSRDTHIISRGRHNFHQIIKFSILVQVIKLLNR